MPSQRRSNRHHPETVSERAMPVSPGMMPRNSVSASQGPSYSFLSAIFGPYHGLKVSLSISRAALAKSVQDFPNCAAMQRGA